MHLPNNFHFFIAPNTILHLGSIFLNQADVQENSISGEVTIDYGMVDGPNSLLTDLPGSPTWHASTAKYVLKKEGKEFLVDPETGEIEGELKESRKPEGLETDDPCRLVDVAAS